MRQLYIHISWGAILPTDATSFTEAPLEFDRRFCNEALFNRISNGLNNGLLGLNGSDNPKWTDRIEIRNTEW